jgi:hypothetical protein
VRLRQRGDAAAFRKPASPGEIGLHDVGGAVGDQLVKALEPDFGGQTEGHPRVMCVTGHCRDDRARSSRQRSGHTRSRRAFSIANSVM